MRSAPWWALLSSGCAPVLLVGSWAIAQERQGPAYDPATDTLSVLASYGATSYWLMTGMLLVLGTSYVVTAHALRRAAPAGRLALAGGGLSALALTLVPAPSSGGALEHGAVATVGLVLLAVWPPLAAVRAEGPAPVGAAPRRVARGQRGDVRERPVVPGGAAERTGPGHRRARRDVPPGAVAVPGRPLLPQKHLDLTPRRTHGLTPPDASGRRARPVRAAPTPRPYAAATPPPPRSRRPSDPAGDPPDGARPSPGGGRRPSPGRPR